MKKEALRLLDILKTCPKLKKEIEELKFGCWVETYSLRTARIIWKDYDENWEFKDRYRMQDDWENIFTTQLNEKILWQATYQHLLRFMDIKASYTYSISGKWELQTINLDIVKFDLKKDILEQEETVLKELNDYLETLTK